MKLTPAYINFSIRVYTITLMNDSGSSITVTSIVSDNAAFTVQNDLCSGGPLAAGASCTFKVAFTPSAAGPQGSNITVTTSAGSIILPVYAIASQIIVWPCTASATSGNDSAASALADCESAGAFLSIQSSPFADFPSVSFSGFALPADIDATKVLRVTGMVNAVYDASLTQPAVAVGNVRTDGLSAGFTSTSTSFPYTTFSTTFSPTGSYPDPASFPFAGVTASANLSASLSGGGTSSLSFTPFLLVLVLTPPPVTIPVKVLPYLFTPKGQNSSVNELDANSTIASLDFEAIDSALPYSGGELKKILADPASIGVIGEFRMGFPSMPLSQFVTLHTTQLLDVGWNPEGRVTFSTAELLYNQQGAIWINGGPHPTPVASSLDTSANRRVPPGPKFLGFAANVGPVSDSNPRYVYGHPIDILLVALQNELGIGQASSDPTAWQFYDPITGMGLINPNRYVDVPQLLALRDGLLSGDHFEFKLTRETPGLQWIQDQILKPLGFYWIVRPDGKHSLKSMHSAPIPGSIPSITGDETLAIPEVTREPVINVVTLRFAPEEKQPRGVVTSGSYQGEIVFEEQDSIQRFKQRFPQDVQADGMRVNYGAFARAELYARRVFRRHAFATPRYKLKLKLPWIRMELGDFIYLTHNLVPDYKNPLGSLGISNVLCEVISKQPSYSDGICELEVLDGRFLDITVSHAIAPAGTPDWTGSSPIQRATYFYIGDADGKNPDASPSAPIW